MVTLRNPYFGSAGILIAVWGIALSVSPLFAAMGEPSALDNSDKIREVPVTGCSEFNVDTKTCRKAFVLPGPAPLEWKEMVERFNPKTRITYPDNENLHYTTGTFVKSEVSTVNLAQEVPKWLALCFKDDLYKADEWWVKSVGNLLETFGNLKGDKSNTVTTRLNFPVLMGN